MPAEKDGLTARADRREVDETPIEVLDLGALGLDALDTRRDRRRGFGDGRLERLDAGGVERATVTADRFANWRELVSSTPKRSPLLDQALGERAHRLERSGRLLDREVLHPRALWWLDR